jgi:hypothetical protein
MLPTGDRQPGNHARQRHHAIYRARTEHMAGHIGDRVLVARVDPLIGGNLLNAGDGGKRNRLPRLVREMDAFKRVFARARGPGKPEDDRDRRLLPP